MKKKTSAVMLAVVILVAGCGGGAKPDPTTTTTASPTLTTPAPNTPAATSPSASPSTTDPNSNPNIPAAAQAHTPAGAAAFVKYFHDQLNVAWGQPQADLLTILSLPGCETCTALEDSAAKNVATHQRVSGDSVRIDTSDPGSTEANGDQTVVLTGSQLMTSVVDSNGHKVRDIPAAKIRSIATSRWTANGWRILEIQVLQ